jgi:ribosomal protein S18 acetylase RimI-like enzyme
MAAMAETLQAIRWARPDDLEEIIELCAEHAHFERAIYSREGKRELLLRYLFGQAPRAKCLVVERVDGGPLAGYATFTLEFSTWDAAEFVHVDCLYLRPSVRNRSLGWQIGKRIANEILAMGVRHVQFQTPSFNEPAIRIYQAMGASRKDKARFYGDRDGMLRFVNGRGAAATRRAEAHTQSAAPEAETVE